MIHDVICKADDLEHVDIKRYVKNLVNPICRSSEKYVPISVDADAVALPLDQTMRLGIILNELRTNTLKHACLDDDCTLNIHITFSSKEG
jgi:two-component sensor histidine kinase